MPQKRIIYRPLVRLSQRGIDSASSQLMPSSRHFSVKFCSRGSIFGTLDLILTPLLGWLEASSSTMLYRLHIPTVYIINPNG